MKFVSHFYFVSMLLFNGLALAKDSGKILDACVWLKDHELGSKRTDPKLTKECDPKSFKVLDYYLAIDKNFVYCKPTPNASNYSIRIDGADANSFRVINERYSADEKCVYQFCQVVVGIKPKGFNPITFNFTKNQKLSSRCE